MSHLVQVSADPKAPLATNIATAISRAQAALFQGKHDIIAVFVYGDTLFHVRPDSDPKYLERAYHPNSVEIVGPYDPQQILSPLRQPLVSTEGETL